MTRRRILATAGLLALLVGAIAPSAAHAGNPHHPYGVIPYGFAYPSPDHIWGALDKVYHKDMNKIKNWGPHGAGYYSCGAGGCGAYGYAPCAGLTPLHYNAISPANYARPYPGDAGLSFYRSTPVGLPPVPGWDIPEYPPGVKGHGDDTYRGLAPGVTGHHDRNSPPSAFWSAGREHEQNFWLRGAAFHGAQPGAH